MISKPKVSTNNLKSERVESSSNLSIFNMMGIEELQKRLVLSKWGGLISLSRNGIHPNS